MRPSYLVLALAALSAAFAVDTHFWTFSAKEDHDKATLKRLSLRSDGRITLAPATRELQDAGVSYLWAVARAADGTLYTGGGNPGATAAKLFAVRNGQATVLAELPGLQIQAIALDPQGRVYAATAPDGKVYRVAADGKFDVFFDPKAKYIWSLVFDKAGNLFVATGDRGEIHKVTPAGQASVFFKTEEEHARSMAVDAAGNLIVGSEPGGLIFRISPAGEGFVLHQAGRREITAIAVAPDGSIYAAGVGSKPTTSSPAPPAAPIAIAPTSITVTASAGPGPAPAAPRPASPPPTLTPSSVSGGSEVIRIAADGFPTRVWVDGAEIVYAIAFDKSGHPILGTGNKGGIYRIDSPLLSTRLVTLAPTQVTALATDPAGAIYAVTGNIGKLIQVGPALEKDGVLESEVLDASWFAEWGRLAPKNTGNVKFETRSGNLDRPQKNWSSWAPVAGRVASPAARFLQYRATLTGDDAAVIGTEIAYLPRNVAPRIEQIEITAPNYRFPNQSLSMTPSSTLTLGPMSSRVPASSPSNNADPGSVTLNLAKGFQGARWKAADPNGDTVHYTVEIRGKNETAWKTLKTEVAVRQFSFDSSAFPDGEYVLRISGTDAPSNPPGKGLSDSLESAPFLIDNTPPAIRNLAATANGNRLTITFAAADASTILTKAEFSINAGDWVSLEPSTKLTDSKEHTYSVTVDRPSGELTIAVRVTDEFDNHSVEKTILR
jgi:sugar lactone lactonase YvrE